MATTEINGVQYDYEVNGSGEAVLFAHCLTWNRSEYDAQVAALAEKYQLILPDQRGHGKTGFVAQAYSLADMAEDLYQLVQALGVGPVHYVGHSMGAMMAPLFALAHPETVRSLTLIGGSPTAESEERLAGYRQLVGAVRAGKAEMVVDRLSGLFFSDMSRAKRPEAVEHFRHDFLTTDGEGLYWTAEAVFTRPDVRPDLPKITAPALIIVGGKDVVTPLDNAQTLAELMPKARLLVLPEVGHFAPVEAPLTVAGALRDFWETV